MHGLSPGSAVFVNAEVDSMGGIIDGGAGLDSKTSPHRVAIEKAQAELRYAGIIFIYAFVWLLYGEIFYCYFLDCRQEFDVREERRRELEFLERVRQYSV